MISIIIPVYNVSNYINQCIESIVSQTYKDFEVILIDDGSTDGSADICDAWVIKDSRIRVIHKENGGVSSARNIGLDQANGEYICFVDADDYVEKNYLNELLKLYDECEWMSQGEKIQLACISFRVKDNQKIKNRSKILCLDREQAEKYLYTKNSFGGWLWNKLFLTSIIKEKNIKFDEALHVREDSMFVQRYINEIKTCRFVNKSLYNYRCSSKNVCKIQYAEEVIPSLDKQISFCMEETNKERVRALKYIYMIRLLKNRLVKEELLRRYTQILSQNKKVILFDRNIKLKYKLYLLIKIH